MKNKKIPLVDKENVMKPKKRGRKPKKKTEQKEKPPPKKRGRKPKGGKIIKKNNSSNDNNEPLQETNIILHLKCNSESVNKTHNYLMNYTPNINDPQAYNLDNNKIFNKNYQELNTDQTQKINKKMTCNLNIKENKKTVKSDDTNIKEIYQKLNILKRNLKNNNVSDKRSACFWCTYEFDNPAIHIPKHYNNNILEVYGCFCSPECALAYLKNEQIDDSTKWERYALLNNVYCKVYNYTKNIKPAPPPQYTLDKFYGNLSIQEYRKLLSKERILMVVNKPMTKILPELYEENNEIPNINNNILDTKNKNNVNFRLQRNNVKKTKSNSLFNNFNL